MKLLQRLSPGNLTPANALILFYATAILAGTLALATPWAAQPVLPFLDALFTATSAQCVTGLVVVDTGSRLTLFGQTVVLALIQLGGIGITTFSVYLFVYLRSGVGLRDRWILHETLMHTPVRSLHELVRDVIHLTLIIEGIGAVLLAIVFVPQFGLANGLYQAVFHSISAFCNAGFSLFPDSLIGYRAHPLVNAVIMTLIILGGIGFLVIRELLDRARQKHGRRRRLSLHTKLVLVTSLVLIVGGAIGIFCLEGASAYHAAPFAERFWGALFQSVSARTAGFNTVDLNTFEVPTLLLMMVLMFIGASPGSTGGGIKTTSLALFVAMLYSRLKGSRTINIFKRTLPEETANKTMTLVMLALLWLTVMAFLLLSVQLPGLSFAESRGAFLDYTFEVVSAFATVGLSLGATAKLGAWGKIIVILLMFVGRIGLLSFAFAVVRRTRSNSAEYAQENIMIG